MARVVAALNKIIPLTYHFAEDRKISRSRPLIVITHHFGGSATSSLRHVNMLSSMGFDCVTFDFSWHGPHPRHPLLFKVLEMWSHDIDQVLEQVDNTHGRRDKLFFSFSGPTASAVISLGQRPQKDIKGLICDSGPFMDPKSCTRLMIDQVYGISNPLRRELTLNAMMLLWGRDADTRLKNALDLIETENPKFPLLSIRGMRDSIVPIENIRRVFENRNNLKLDTLELDAGHLTGLKEQPDIYKSNVKGFLKRWT